MICKVLQRKISHIFMIMISCLRFFTLLMNKAWANDPKVKLHHIYLPSLIPKLEASLGINCYTEFPCFALGLSFSSLELINCGDSSHNN
jgi:hypothetical protein